MFCTISMEKDLVLIESNEIFDKIYNYFKLFIKKFLRVKKCNQTLYYRLKFRKLLKRNKELKNSGLKIINIDNLSLLRYKIPAYTYKASLKKCLIEAKEIFKKIEEKIKTDEILFRNINLNYAYHHHHNVLATWIFLDFYLSLKLLLESYKFRNIYIPKKFQILSKLIQLIDKEKKINSYYYETLFSNNFLNKNIIRLKKKILIIYRFLGELLRSESIKNYRKNQKNQFSTKYIFNKKKQNIGFFYYSIIHKRVGESLFNYLKEQKINVVEINPDYCKYLKNIKVKFNTKKDAQKIYLQIKNFYFKCAKSFNEKFSKLLILNLISFISQNIDSDLKSVNLIRKKILENNLTLLIIFNEVSFQGKIAALLCKQLNIATLYIPHGSIGENYLYVSPKDCDIMILNAEIEKKFLLDGRLDPKKYSDKLIPIGSFYFSTQNLMKVNYVEDIYTKKKVLLNNYKYKILIAISYDYYKRKYPYRNIILFNDFFSYFENQNNYQEYLLIIKLHPTDDFESYRNYFQRKRKINFVVSHRDDIRNLIITSDLFLTTPSATILEGILFKVPTIILDYYYILIENLYNDEKTIKTIRNRNEFVEINKYLIDKEFCREYINKTYNFGLQFCKNYNEQNIQTINEKIFEIIEKIIKERKLN